MEFCLAPVVYVAQLTRGPGPPGLMADVRKQPFNLSIYCDIILFANFSLFVNFLSDFVVWTDHVSLAWLTNFRNPEGQLARWLEQLPVDLL